MEKIIEQKSYLKVLQKQKETSKIDYLKKIYEIKNSRKDLFEDTKINYKNRF